MGAIGTLQRYKIIAVSRIPGLHSPKYMESVTSVWMAKSFSEPFFFLKIP